jgi:ribonuclease HI
MHAIHAWERIGASDLVRQGVRAEWRLGHEPEELRLRPWPPPFRGTPTQRAAYQTELQKELDEEIVELTTYEEAKWVNPTFLIEKRPGEWRKILNCIDLNSWIRDKGLKMEGIQTIFELSQRGDWATTLDIKAAYSHVPVADDLKPYLCFQFNGQVYRYRTMPFGLKSAPRVFSRLMRRVATWIRSELKTKMAIYMDDLMIVAATKEEAKQKTEAVLRLLTSLGWTLSLDKCHPDPSQTVKFLGWNLDFQRQELKMTDNRRATLLETLFAMKTMAAQRGQIACRQLASTIGSLNFLRAQFPMASLYMTRLNQTKTQGVRKSGWSGKLTMTPRVQGEIKWWLAAISHNTPLCWAPRPRTTTLTTDASPWGWGATMEGPGRQTHYMWGEWNKQQKQMTSNQKELTAIARALRASIPSLPGGSAVMVRSDNTAAVFGLRRWRGNLKRAPVLREIYNMTKRIDCTIQATYLPGAQNGAADSLSRMGSAGEYYMTTATMQKILTHWNVHLTVDIFASEQTARLDRYCTRDPKDANAMAIDGLDIEWTNEVVLLHPPLTLILKTIRKAIQEAATGILIVPDWTGQTWYPLLQTISEGVMDLGPYPTAVQKTAEMISRGWRLPPGNAHAHILGTKTTAVKTYSTN